MILPSVLMVGTGEYTIGIAPSNCGKSDNKTDKKLGVIALVMFDLRRRGLVENIGLCGTSSHKVDMAKTWLHEGIGKLYSLDVHLDYTWPKSGVDKLAYREAIESLPEGSVVTIFTPDTSHYEIALFAIQNGMHVMIAKPAVISVQEHQSIIDAANAKGVLVCVEFHKRFDPIYQDAREQIPLIGDFNYFYSYMSQPKYQLETFKSWAGKESDISYYLNSHHIDFLTWSIGDSFEPIEVVAFSGSGTASECGCVEGTDDTITIMCRFQQNLNRNKVGLAVFTSSWVAPNKSECHSQQRFHYLASQAEIRVDQAHRGYELTSDTNGYTSKNPLFMKYTKSKDGKFVGQNTYGYKSFETWIRACVALKNGLLTMKDGQLSVTDKTNNNDLFDESIETLATIQSTLIVTKILEAGKKSLATKEPVRFC